MKKVLGRKQNMKPADEKIWWDVINHIEEYVSRDEVARATDIARARILKITKGKKAAYAWSGGKDSLVVADLCRSARIGRCYCLITELEYPAWLKFLHDNKPSDCEMINVGFGLDYLAVRPEMIFPKGKTLQHWYNQVQHKNHARYMEANALDVLIVGRRNVDGNVCGKNGLNIRKDGRITYSPIYDWSHELLFAYMRYNAIKIPIIYKWYRGFYNGTHLWAERKVESKEQGYREVYELDPSVVVQVAEKLPSQENFWRK